MILVSGVRRHPRRRKMCHRNPWEDKNKEVKGGHVTRPPCPPSFDVSVPEKLRKIVATRGEILSLKFTKYRLAAGLRPDPLGELKRSPRPPIRKKGPTSKGREEGEEKGGKRDKKTGTPRATCHVVVAYRPIAYRRPTFDDDDKTTTR